MQTSIKRIDVREDLNYEAKDLKEGIARVLFGNKKYKSDAIGMKYVSIIDLF